MTEELAGYYDLVDRAFSRLAPWYDVLTRPFTGLREEAVEVAGFPTWARVLDVATGTGAQALAFARRGYDVTGIDLTEAMLARARAKPDADKVRFSRMDATRLEFADGAFGAACVSFALHDMPRPVRERVLAEMARVVVPGGRVLVVDWGLPRGRVARALVYGFVGSWESPWYREFMTSDLVADLGRAGIEVEVERPAMHGIARLVRGHVRG